MSAIVQQPTTTALWHELIEEAMAASDSRLDGEIEGYLVMLLMRFTEQPEIAARVLALDYLEGLQAIGAARQDRLRDVGDLCLLLAGLFPQRAERRRVRIGYYVDLGRGAYQALSEQYRRGIAQLYAQLARKFVALMDVLHAVRRLGSDQPLCAPLSSYELWQQTGSASAYRELLRQTGGAALPLVIADRRPH